MSPKKNAPKLGVNVDHVATVRQARGTNYPDPVAAALEAIKGGADQITVHLREDRRHIQGKDVASLRREIDKSLNLEMAATDAMLKKALQLKPDTVTLVPERRRELTTEGGLDVTKGKKRLKKVISELKGKDIRVSLFIDPKQSQIDSAAELGVKIIELHTGRYANAKSKTERADRREELLIAARYAGSHHFYVAAGHGLHLDNIREVANMPEIREFNIGHSLIARAIFVGIEEAVREMKERIASVVKGNV